MCLDRTALRRLLLRIRKSGHVQLLLLVIPLPTVLSVNGGAKYWILVSAFVPSLPRAMVQESGVTSKVRQLTFIKYPCTFLFDIYDHK